VLFGVISWAKKGQTASFSAYWATLAFLYFFLSLDEATSIHEMFSDPLREHFNTGGIFYYGWVIIALPLSVLFLLFFWRFLRHLPLKTRRQILVAWTVFFSGAVLVEMIGGWYEGNYGANSLVYTLITTVEESLEMTGVMLLIHALLIYLAENISEIRWVFSRSDS
jgi:hypothetical protein